MKIYMGYTKTGHTRHLCREIDSDHSLCGRVMRDHTTNLKSQEKVEFSSHWNDDTLCQACSALYNKFAELRYFDEKTQVRLI